MNGSPSPARSRDRWFAVVDGVRLQRLRRRHGLSAAELAGKAGIGSSTVSRLEGQTRSSCRTRTLARLAAALGEPAKALALSEPPPEREATSRLRENNPLRAG
jgi:transcriptional regulator with XRE-family HTH domain